MLYQYSYGRYEQQMKMLMKSDHIAPCGMNCSLCIHYQSNHLDFDEVDLNKENCKGCIEKGRTCSYLSNHCENIPNFLVRFCYECDVYPCQELIELDEKYKDKNHLSIIENLNMISFLGLDVFIKSENLKWRCSNCNSLICCYNGLCLNCEIEILKENKNYRWNQSVSDS